MHKLLISTLLTCLIVHSNYILHAPAREIERERIILMSTGIAALMRYAYNIILVYYYDIVLTCVYLHCVYLNTHLQIELCYPQVIIIEKESRQ